ncbi:MAG: lysophospholipid acyltransferase family protein [Polyangia bacterium]
MRRLKNTAIFLFARAAVALAGLVPATLVRPCGAAVGSLALLLAPRQRKLARRQLAAAFSLQPHGRRARILLHGVFSHLGTGAIELCRLLRRPAAPLRVELPSPSREALERALSRGRGAVFVTGHIGNWELMAISLARLGYPISTVARESYDPRFTRLLDRGRSSFGVSSIFRGRPGAAARMLRALRANRILGFLIDQDTRVDGVFAPFFGREAHTPIGPAAIARRTGTPLLVGSIRRLRNGGHLISIQELHLPGDDAGAALALNAELERRVRLRPSQWVWLHDRWRTRPPDGDRAASKGQRAA